MSFIEYMMEPTMIAAFHFVKDEINVIDVLCQDQGWGAMLLRVIPFQLCRL